MKKLLVLALASLTLIAGPAFADTSIAVVNYVKIAHDSKAGVSVRAQIQTKEKGLQADFEAKQKEFYAEDQSLAKQQSTTDKAAFEKKVKDFRAKAADAERDMQAKKMALAKSADAAGDELQKNVLDVAKQVASERKYNIVLSTTSVMYADDSLDITDEVLKRLDAKLPTLSVK
jgi:outer membrane protein